MTTTTIDRKQIIKFQKDFNEFAKHTFLFRYMKKTTFFCPLVIQNCNGTGPCPFNDATIHFKNADHCFPAFMWYKNEFKYIGKEIYMIDSPEALKEKGRIRYLIDALTGMSEKHGKCLKQLLEDDSLTEEKIKCILAVHYFKPLSNDAEVLVDRNQGCEKCPMCNVDVKADHRETSFGNTSVWHGQADILVHNSIVKIGIDALDTLSLEESSEGLDVSDCSENVDGKTEDTQKRLKSQSQAIAQTIVNAFVESEKDKSLFNKFIPSFLATEKNVRILLYNCNLDKLLVSDELDIWELNGSLCMETMMFIWLAMNSHVNDMDDTVKHLLENTAESKFKEVVGEAYEIYLKDVTRPYKKQHKEEFTLNQPFHQTVKKKDVEFIYEVGMELFQATCRQKSKELT